MDSQQMHEVNPKPQPLRVYLWSVLFLIAVVVATALIVRANKRPGQMTLIESQGMDMTVMKAPTGSVPVALETVEAGRFEAAVTYSGTVVPYSEQEISARVEGWIEEITVYPGDTVKKGQLVARLGSPDITLRSEAAYADARAANSSALAAGDEIARMEQMVKSAEAALDAAEAEADYRDSELARMEKLFQSGAVSRSEYEQERAMNASAHAEVRKMEAETQAAHRNLDAMKRQRNAMQDMARAGGARAASERTVAGYLELRSLINGVVTERLLSPGTLARPGVPILRIADIGRVRLQANVSETDAANIAVGNTVEVTTPRRPGATLTASVSSVFPAADPTTRTAVIEAVVDNADHKFLPGDYVSLRIGAGRRDRTVSIPDRAIVHWGNEGKPFVWTALSGGASGKPTYTCVMHPEVVSDKPGKCPKCGMDLVPKKTGGQIKAHRVDVVVGRTDGDRTEILSGLQPGDRVVMDGGGSLNEGDVLFETKWSPEGPSELPPAPAMEEGHGGMDMPGMGKSGKKSGKKSGGAYKEQDMKNMPGMTHGAPAPGAEPAAVKPAGDSGRKDKQQGAVYTCPMHPEVKSDKPGDCPKCGMKLTPVSGNAHKH